MKYPDLYHYYANLSELSQDDWLQMEVDCLSVSLQKGDHIFRTGDHCANIFAIRKGVAKTYFTDLNGKEYIKIFLTDGQIVSPYLEMVQQIPSRASAECLTPIEGVTIPLTSLLKLLESTPQHQTLHLRLVQFFYEVKERREYQLLTMDAKARYEAYLEQYKDYVDIIPDKQVALYLGISPVSLSRLRNQRVTKK